MRVSSLFSKYLPQELPFVSIKLLHLALNEGLDGGNITLLRLVFDNTSVGLYNIDSWERFGVELSLDKVPNFITTEFEDIHSSLHLRSEFGIFLLHSLAELAPRSINGDNRGLSRLNNLKGSISGLDVLDSSLFPQISVESLFSSSNVDTTFSLGRSIFVGKSNEASFTFGGIVEP